MSATLPNQDDEQDESQEVEDVPAKIADIVYENLEEWVGERHIDSIHITEKYSYMVYDDLMGRREEPSSRDRIYEVFVTLCDPLVDFRDIKKRLEKRIYKQVGGEVYAHITQ